MTSLNNFYLRDLTVSKAVVCWNAFKRVKVESKLLSCLTLPLTGIKCISNPFRYFIPPLAYVKSQRSRIQRTGKVMTYFMDTRSLTFVKARIKAVFIFDFALALIKIEYTVNPMFCQLFHLCMKENQHSAKQSLLVEK